MNIKIPITYIIIMVLILLLALSWGRKPKTIEKIVNKIEYKDTTIYKVDTIFIDRYVPKYISKVITDTVTIEKIDTNYVILDYFNEYVYNDTLFNDTRGLISIKDTIQGNRIKSRAPFISLNKQIEYKTKIEYKNKARFYLGGSLTTHPTLFLEGMYVSPNRGAYSAGYDPINEQFRVGAYFKVF